MHKKNRGFCEIVIIFILAFISIMLSLFFSMIVLVQNIYTVSLGLKEDMYNVNRTVINSIVKDVGKYDYFEVDYDEYKKQLSKILILNYGLNSQLKEGIGLVESIELMDYKFEDNCIYTKLRVNINTPIFFSILKNLKTIEVLEKTNVKKVIL